MRNSLASTQTQSSGKQMDLSKLLHSNDNIDTSKLFDQLDTNNDGQLDISDLPFEPGSTEAKLWFEKVLIPYTKTQITPEMREQYGDKVVGAYKGKALVPGVAGSKYYPQGDFELLRDRIMIKEGLTYESAVKIAASVKNKLYGN